MLNLFDALADRAGWALLGISLGGALALLMMLLLDVGRRTRRDPPHAAPR